MSARIENPYLGPFRQVTYYEIDTDLGYVCEYPTDGIYKGTYATENWCNDEACFTLDEEEEGEIFKGEKFPRYVCYTHEWVFYEGKTKR